VVLASLGALLAIVVRLDAVQRDALDLELPGARDEVIVVAKPLHAEMRRVLVGQRDDLDVQPDR